MEGHESFFLSFCSLDGSGFGQGFTGPLFASTRSLRRPRSGASNPVLRSVPPFRSRDVEAVDAAGGADRFGLESSPIHSSRRSGQPHGAFHDVLRLGRNAGAAHR